MRIRSSTSIFKQSIPEVEHVHNLKNTLDSMLGFGSMGGLVFTLTRSVRSLTTFLKTLTILGEAGNASSRHM